MIDNRIDNHKIPRKRNSEAGSSFKTCSAFDMANHGLCYTESPKNRQRFSLPHFPKALTIWQPTQSTMTKWFPWRACAKSVIRWPKEAPAPDPRRSPFSVGCLWNSHGKNPVRLYPKLPSQPIGLPKIFIDYLFFQADQSDCTKSVSIFNRFASSEERWNQNVPCQICRAWVFPLVV